MESRRRPPAASADDRCSMSSRSRLMLLTLIVYHCLSTHLLSSRVATATNSKRNADCTPCDVTSYELQPCRPKSTNRQCISVAVSVPATAPEEVADYPVTPTYLEGLEAEASPNVILENLHDTRNLETTYYVTDMTQASDFYWDRESGLRVNIGILNVHLVPEYEDVEHDGGDNKYMLSNPNNVEDRVKYQNVLRQFCRYPIPDHYSITLEISRDRTTTAREFHCNSKGQSDANCPLRHRSSGPYLQRDVNEACQKMGTFPEPLKPAANSIVCTENTNLLRDLFDQTYSVERSIKFPTKKCRSAISRCEQCLGQARCASNESSDKRCCQIDCYTLSDCKLAFSAECTRVPVECAMGDAYRYTIQPMYHALRADAQCHIRRRQLNVLYELFFFLQLPPSKSPAIASGAVHDAGVPPYGPTGEPLFQTPKVHRTIRAASGDRAYRNRGFYTADYLTVEHSTGLDLDDELILRRHEGQSITSSSSSSSGTRVSGSTGRGVSYTVRPVTDDGVVGESGTGRTHSRPSVHEISRNIFVVSTQFERPFDYSTTSWTLADDCDKNATKMRPVVRHNASNELPVTANVQASSEPFRYFLKSTENPPYIRFTVPGNTSILPYYFDTKSPSLRLDHSLQVALRLMSSGTVWEFSISGHMTGCPSYVAIAIIDLTESEELFRYDALVLCPPSFNVTLRAPNLGPPFPPPPSPYWSGNAERTPSTTTTFQVRLTDPSRTYSVYTTHVELSPAQIDGAQDDGGTGHEVRHDRKSEAVAVQTARVGADRSSSASVDESVLFAALAAAILVSVGALSVTLAYADPTTADGVRRLRSTTFGSSCCRPSTGSCDLPPYGYSYCNSCDAARRPKQYGNDDDLRTLAPVSISRNLTSAETDRCGDMSHSPDDDGSRRLHCCASSSAKSSSSANTRSLVIVYITLWVVYSCTATFTAVSFAIGAFVRPEIDRFHSTADSFRLLAEGRASTNQSSILAIDLHRRNELRRLTGQVLERHRACATHVDRLYTGWAAAVDRSSLDVAGGQRAECRPSSAIGHLLEQRYGDRVTNYAAAMSEYERKFRSYVIEALRHSIDKYNAYLESVIDSPWVSFVSTSLYNGTLLPVARDSARRRLINSVDDAKKLTFGEAFEVDEVTTVDEWTIKFWQRYNRWLPDLPTWPAVDGVVDVRSESTTGCAASPVHRLSRNMTSLSSSFRELFDSTRFVVSSGSTHSTRRPAATSSSSPTSAVDEEFYWVFSSPFSNVPMRKFDASFSERRKSNGATGGNSDGRKSTRPTSTDVSSVDKASNSSKPLTSVVEALSSLRVLFVVVDALLVLFHVTRAYYGYHRLLRCCGKEGTEELATNDFRSVDRRSTPLHDGCLRNGGSGGGNGLSLPTPAITVDFDRASAVVLPTPDRLIVADWTVEMCSGGHESGVVEYFRKIGDKYVPSTTTTSDAYSSSPRKPEMEKSNHHTSFDGEPNRPNDVTDPVVSATESQKNIYRWLSANLRIVIGVLNTCGRVVASQSLLPVIGCAVLLAVSHALLRSTCRSLDVELDWNRRRDRLDASRLWSSDLYDTMSGVDLVGALYVAVNRYHVIESNDYVREETQYLQDALLSGHGNCVVNELMNLQALIEHFDAERLRWFDSDVINHDRVRRTSIWNRCDVDEQFVTSSTVPIVPCHFIPIMPSIYSDTGIENADGDAITSLWKLLDTVRRLVIVTSYTMLVAMTIALLLRFALLLVCRQLAVTSSHIQRRADDINARFSHSTIADVISSRFCCRSKNDEAGNYDDGGDVEDDNDVAVGSPQRSMNSVGFVFCEQAPADLRYIETKV